MRGGFLGAEMVEFWIAWTVIVAIITFCSYLNANLHHLLKKLIPFLKETLRPALLNGFSNQARILGKDKIPEYEEWFSGAIWYGALTFVLIGLMFVGGLFATFLQIFPYILLLVIILLLGSMVAFFPRIVTRRAKIIVEMHNYYESYEALQRLEQENTTYGSNSGTNSHN